MFAMVGADYHCLENCEVLDQIIKATLPNNPNTAPNILPKILLEFDTLSGINDRSEILLDKLT